MEFLVISMALFKLHKEIKIDGMSIKSEKDFVDSIMSCMGVVNWDIGLISELKNYLVDKNEKIKVVWLNSQKSKELMVRISDVPIEELTKDGSLMQRDILLELIWEKQSLYDKAISLLKGMKQLDLKLK